VCVCVYVFMLIYTLKIVNGRSKTFHGARRGAHLRLGMK